MPRKKMKTDAPESAAWAEHPPRTPKYWFYGGPWVPPDQIVAGPSTPKPEHVRATETPGVRQASVAKLLADAEDKLPERIAHYLDLRKRGIEALPWEWAKEAMRKNPDRGTPNDLHFAFSNVYRDIEELRGQIPVYRQLLVELESATMPLFHQPKKP